MGKRHDKTGRSMGESRHVRLYHWVMDCEAWKSLSALDRAVYIEIARRYGGTGSNNGRIPYSVREAATTFRIGKTTAGHALKRLEDRCFIECMTKGGFSVNNKKASEWRLTEFACDVSGEIASKGFARWVPESGQKIQKQVPSQVRKVPSQVQSGTGSGTMEGEKAHLGTCDGTEMAQSPIASVPVAGHQYVTRGGAAEAKHFPSPPNPEAGRSAPPRTGRTAFKPFAPAQHYVHPEGIEVTVCEPGQAMQQNAIHRNIGAPGSGLVTGDCHRNLKGCSEFRKPHFASHRRSHD
jgi:hypothetical protein